MSDLISRSKAIQMLIQETTDSKSNLIHINTVKRLLQDVDTAYDIDKVVEELENNSFITVKQEEVQTKRKDIQSYIAVEKEVVLLKDAIEIVKQGGVADDVCEWKKGSRRYVGYHAYYSKCCTTKSNGLEMQTHIIADWKYCPYCGKKIKVVE